MRLETDLNSTTAIDGAVVDAAIIGNYDRQANEALREGVQAAQAGDRAGARTALLRATELNPSSESAWLWLASISEYPEELLIFLNNVLDINPHNGRALEWIAATKSLLAKTFVQRGIDAAGGGQADLAAQCFNQALENDQANADAWLWLAKLADSPEGKLTYLEKVVEIDPSNQEAKDEYAAAQNKINQSLLAEARAAAVAGRNGDANDLLDAFISVNPESEDGWILRAHLADGFDAKIKAFEQVIAINPQNSVAASGIGSLRSIMAMVAPQPVEPPPAPVVEMENTALVLESQRESVNVHDKSPTQDLEFPDAAAELHERETGSPFESFAEEAAAVAEPSASNADWAMNTVAFSFAFPGGNSSDATEENAPEVEAKDNFEFSAVTEDYSVADDDLYQTEEYAPVPSPASLAEEFAPVPSPAGAFAETTVQFDREAVVFEAIENVENAPVENTIEFHASVEDQPVEESIPMPLDFTVADVMATTGYETRLVSAEPAVTQTECPFCKADNPAQAFTCGSCLATLTLSDLEMLLANSHADKTALRAAVKEMEEIRESRPLSEKELTNCGVAFLNLRDFDSGLNYLQEASHLNPNNVVLGSQVNSLLIRLDEIKRQEEAAEARPKEKRILVVDDSATVRKLIAGKLEKSGHEVFCAADGVEAIEQLDTMVPDLVLLDITMPRMDGYQVCKVIRGKDATKDVPVVMISGKDGFFDKVRGRMAGTTGYITKPFGPETLMKAVETYLSGAPVEI
ncbi:MAG TPA: response regulator [Pyrinomonadaceae bacterium]|nr:response regulator [Pyrinomonadaceae bacterium]